MNLGDTIHQLHVRNHLSQEALVDALGVSRQSVSKWENGNAVPELDKLVKMSALFSVSLDELVRNQTAPSLHPRVDPPQTQDSAPVTTADIVGVLILLFGILIPILILTTSSLHDSTLLMVLGLFVIPPLSILCAALCAPKNRVLFRVSWFTALCSESLLPSPKLYWLPLLPSSISLHWASGMTGWLYFLPPN